MKNTLSIPRNEIQNILIVRLASRNILDDSVIDVPILSPLPLSGFFFDLEAVGECEA